MDALHRQNVCWGRDQRSQCGDFGSSQRAFVGLGEGIDRRGARGVITGEALGEPSEARRRLSHDAARRLTEGALKVPSAVELREPDRRGGSSLIAEDREGHACKYNRNIVNMPRMWQLEGYYGTL